MKAYPAHSEAPPQTGIWLLPNINSPFGMAAERRTLGRDRQIFP